MSDVVDIKRWVNKSLEISVWTIRVKGVYWFFAREFASSLGYADPRDPIKDLIELEDKKTIEELLGKDYKKILEKSLDLTLGKFPRVEFFQIIRKNQNLTNEFGLYSLCTRSRKEKAKPFQRWIYNTIAEIRETGSYTLPCGPIENPLNLIAEVTNLKKEMKSLKKGIKTCDKETQTSRSVIVLDGSFVDLEDRIIKALKRNKSSIKRSIKEIRLDLEKYNKRASSSSSPHRLYYSSDSD